MERCKSCKIKYPYEILNMDICGICALEWSNAELGINRKKFNGEIAEDMRQGAVEFRRKNNIKV